MAYKLEVGGASPAASIPLRLGGCRALVDSAAADDTADAVAADAVAGGNITAAVESDVAGGESDTAGGDGCMGTGFVKWWRCPGALLLWE